MEKEIIQLRQEVQNMQSALKDIITMQMYVYQKHFPDISISKGQKSDEVDKPKPKNSKLAKAK